MKFNENLRTLRKEKNLTQEKLAEKFNVSVQAVSRWELGESYPSIELLPIISEYFNITIDELLNNSTEENNEEIDKILKEADKLSKDPFDIKNLKKAKELITKELKRYPNNYRLLYNLLFISIRKGEVEDYKDIITYGNKIMNSKANSEYKNISYLWMCMAHKELGEMEKAIEIANNLPDVSTSKEHILLNILEGEEKEIHIQQTIKTLIEEIIVNLHFVYNNEHTKEEYKKSLKKGISLIELFFEKEDYGDFNNSLRYLYEILMYISLEDKNKVEVLEYLEKTIKYGINYDKLICKNKHTSLLFNKITLAIGKYDFNSCERLLEIIKNKDFDFIKEDEEFKKLVNILEENKR